MKNPKQKTFYIYHEVDGCFIGTGDSMVAPDNATFTSPFPIPKERIPYWSEGGWVYRPVLVAEVTGAGQFFRVIDLPRPEIPNVLIVDELPPEESEDYIWDGETWQHIPKPSTMTFPEFANGEWVETGTPEQINKQVDVETAQLIKDWCRGKGYAEEQILCLGIENKSDPVYQEYKKEKGKIIKAQRSKKVGYTS